MKLVDCELNKIGRGSIFRCSGCDVYESIVDFTLVETFDPDRPLGIMVATGYKSGITLVHLPSDAVADGTRMLSVPWIQKNWGKWVFPECPLEEVQFVENYPPPNCLVFDKTMTSEPSLFGEEVDVDGKQTK